ncbi:MAG: response regulator [Mariprofundaceae bacterium]|nr:response regulator [Mariprofundaceae bacterium]
MAKASVLIVEDDPAIARLIDLHLSHAGYKTDCCDNGRHAADRLMAENYQLLVLDRMIPGMAGLELTRWLRKQEKTRHLPILMITALSMPEERVRGLNEGVDDYLGKPFEPEEMIARVKALLRRRHDAAAKDDVSTGPIYLNTDALNAKVGGKIIDLRPLEFKLLQILMKKPEKVRTRDYLLDHVWGVNAFVEERTVDVTIKRLRKALNKHGMGDYIRTVRGAGYCYTLKQPDES